MIKVSQWTRGLVYKSLGTSIIYSPIVLSLYVNVTHGNDSPPKLFIFIDKLIKIYINRAKQKIIFNDRFYALNIKATTTYKLTCQTAKCA